MARPKLRQLQTSVVLALVLTACAHNPLADIDPSQLSLDDTRGGRVRMTAYTGQVVLVNFFATWCFFCLGDIPRLEQLQETRAKDGLQVIGVGLDREGLQVLQPFREYYHLTYPILIGADRFSREGLPFAPVTVLPTSYLVGRDGRVLEKWEGVLPAKLLDAVIDNALSH
jgi:peroxiredoxin